MATWYIDKPNGTLTISEGEDARDDDSVLVLDAADVQRLANELAPFAQTQEVLA